MVHLTGLYRLRSRNDVPVVRFRIEIEDKRYVGYIWTDDGTLDKVGRAPDVAPNTLIELEKSLEAIATVWLLSKCNTE